MPLGARLQPPYPPNSLEEAIWTEPFPTGRSPYKVSPHVCDILALAGLVEYGYVTSHSTGRMIQGVHLIVEVEELTSSETVLPVNSKARFLDAYKKTIIEWTRKNKRELIDGRASYSWNGEALKDSIDRRNDISALIVLSRIRNGSGVDLDTLDKVMVWGGFNHFPLRDPNEVLTITKEAFDNLDRGNVKEAICRLLSIPNVGISRASKILGLFDQDIFCIYDSRVGTALRTLEHRNERLILCPPGLSRRGDICSDLEWAEMYKKLIWCLEVMRDYLNGEGYPFRIADVEIALFMMGK